MRTKLDYQWLRKSSIFIGFLLIIFIGFLDFYIGYEYAFSVFYLFPIALVTWYSNPKIGFLTCIISALIWFWADSHGRPPHSSPFIPFWNTSIRLSFFVIVHQLLISLKNITHQLETEKNRLSAVIKGTDVGSWEWNIQTGEVALNERWAEIVGYNLKELEPISIATWERLAHPDDLQESTKQLHKYFEGELDNYECESRMLHKDGHWVWVLDKGKIFSWTNEGKPLMMFGSHQDITNRKLREQLIKDLTEQLERLSITDSLTGLLNRRGWEECVFREESRAQRYGNEICVVILDLDNLKTTNDQDGHLAGDILLQRTAECIRNVQRDGDIVARIGGDEFAVLAIECNAEAGEKLLNRIEEKLSANHIQASCGFAVRTLETGVKGALHVADQRMYLNKNIRKSR